MLIYKSELEKTLNLLMKSRDNLSKHERRRLSYKDKIRRYARELSILPNLDLRIFAEELRWHEEGRHYIALTDEDVVRIGKLCFSADSLTELRLPFRFFRVAFPNATCFGGIRASGLQVSLYRIATLDSELYDDLRAFSILPNHVRVFAEGVTDLEATTSQYLSVVYSSHEGGTVTTAIPLSRLPALVNDDTVWDELVPRVGFDLSDAEARQQHAVLGFVSRLVLLLAADPNCVRDGLPAGVEPLTPSWETPPRYHSVSVPLGEADPVTGHFRSAHFRNLRADRFYQPPWDSWAPGTRWTLVRGAVVGSLTPHAIEESP